MKDSKYFWHVSAIFCAMWEVIWFIMKLKDVEIIIAEFYFRIPINLSMYLAYSFVESFRGFINIIQYETRKSK